MRTLECTLCVHYSVCSSAVVALQQHQEHPVHKCVVQCVVQHPVAHHTQGIAAFGGYRVVAERLGWSMTRKVKGFWKSLEDVVPSFVEVATLLAQQQQEHGSRAQDTCAVDHIPVPLGSPPETSVQPAALQQQLTEPSQEQSTQLTMPSRAQLRSLGRNDLLHVLTKYSVIEVAQAAGLAMTGVCV